MGKEEWNLKLKEENRQLRDELKVLREAYAVEKIPEWERKEDISIAELFGIALQDEEEKEEVDDVSGKKEETVAISSEEKSPSESVRSEDVRMGTNNL